MGSKCGRSGATRLSAVASANGSIRGSVADMAVPLEAMLVAAIAQWANTQQNSSCPVCWPTIRRQIIYRKAVPKCRIAAQTRRRNGAATDSTKQLTIRGIE